MGHGARLWAADLGRLRAPAGSARPRRVAAGAGRRAVVTMALLREHADCLAAAMADLLMGFRMDRQAAKACRLSKGSHHVLSIDPTPSGPELELPAAAGGSRRWHRTQHLALLPRPRLERRPAGRRGLAAGLGRGRAARAPARCAAGLPVRRPEPAAAPATVAAAAGRRRPGPAPGRRPGLATGFGLAVAGLRSDARGLTARVGGVRR